MALPARLAVELPLPLPALQNEGLVRSRIRSGHGPENMTLLRRFAIGLIKTRGLAVAETMRNLARNPRRVLDFLKMTGNVAPRPVPG